MPRFRPTLTRLDDRLTPTTLPAGFAETQLAAGLSAPTALAVAPDGRVFVAEQAGALRVVWDGGLRPAPVLSVPVDSQGERGLIGLTLDPDFARTGFVYVYYTVPAAAGRPAFNRVSRFTLSGDAVVPGSERVLVDLDPLSAATNHNGGALRFGADGKLYVAVGENANTANSQTLANRHGKILRLNPDGSIPADNPTAFPGVAGTPTGANRAIWAVGLRNPFTLAVQPGTGRLFINDVGGGLAEEVNDGEAGANYGWPATEGDFDQGKFPSFTRPVHAYPHGSGSTSVGRSVIGGAFLNPTTPTFPADYAGDYFFADLVGNYINRLDLGTGKVDNFASDLTGKQPVGLAVTADGDVLYLARGGFGAGPGAGGLYRVRFGAGPLTPPPGPQAPARPPVAVGAGAGADPVVATYDPATGREVARFRAFEPGFAGGVRVATADVTGDRVADVVAGAGPGGGPRVLVFDGATGRPVRDLFAFEPTFTGGVTVAAADVDRDGFADLLIGADATGGPRVRVVSGRTGATLADFFAFETTFTGGVRAAAGDMTGDGAPDLMVAAGAGGGPRVAVFDGTDVAAGAANPRRAGADFFAFEPGLRDGAFVAAGDVDGDGAADLIAGAGAGGAPRVTVFGGRSLLAGTRAALADFFAGDPAGRSGTAVGAADADGDGRADVLAAPAGGPGAEVTAYRVAAGGATAVRTLAGFGDAGRGVSVG